MRDGDRGQDGTLPGVGGPAPAAVDAHRATVAASPAAGFAETQPARDVTATDAARAKQRLATDPTMQSDPTIDGPMAATLPGPHGVADLPHLQRIDDSAYAIGEELARGGMGKILFARDRRLRRDVVIKVMRRDSGRIDPRFEREALITARLQHPSIVRVYDAGVFGDGRAFYAMERVRGRSLDVVIADAKTVVWNGPMGVFEVAPFAKGTLAVANAVAAVKGTTIIGGGDSVAAINAAGVADKMTHISTGGGASLEFLGGRMLPGVAALPDR